MRYGFISLRLCVSAFISLNGNSRWLALLLLLALALPVTAKASVAEIYGFGSRATAMGGAFTAVADDFSAVYYNPAGLVFQRQPALYHNNKGFRTEIGFLYADPSMWVRRLDAGDLDLHAPGYEAFPGGVSSPGETAGINLGVVFEPFDIGGLLPEKAVTFGLGLHIPSQRLYWWRPQVPEEVHFIFHEDYSQRMLILPAIAYKISDRLSVGIGTSILFKIKTKIYGPINLPLEQLDVSDMRIEVGYEDVFLGSEFAFTLRPAPIVGILAEPIDLLRIGLTYRGELYIHDVGTTDPILRITLPGLPPEALPGLAFGFDHRFCHFYTPHEIALGLYLQRLGPLRISLDVTWMDWSGFRERERVSNPRPEPVFEDTFVPRVGLAYEVNRRITVRCGYFYYDSPVPEQRGDNNDMDNDRHIFSIGSDLLYGPLIASWHFQYQYVVSRRYEKEDPLDPYAPGLRFGGHIINAGLNLSAAF